MVDIVLAIVTAVVVTLLALLSIPTAKPWQKWAAWSLGALAIILIGVQAYRSRQAQEVGERAQEVLRAEIRGIPSETARVFGALSRVLPKDDAVRLREKLQTHVIRGAQPTDGEGALTREQKIAPLLIHADTWDNYLEATPRAALKPLTRLFPVRHRYTRNPLPLEIGIGNFNEAVPLEDARLFVEFLDNGLEVRADGLWQMTIPNAAFNYFFSTIHNAPIAPGAPLWVRFPRPGAYRVRLGIDGRGIRPINIPFTVEMYQ